MSVLNKWNLVLNKVLVAIGVTALLLLMSHVVLHALLRFFFTAPIYGTNEMVTYWYLPALALMGIPLAQFKDEHISVTLVLERMRNPSRRWLRVFSYSAAGLVSVAFAWFGLGSAVGEMNIGSTAGVTDIIIWPVYFLVPVAFVLLALNYLIGTIDVIRIPKPNGQDAPNDQFDVTQLSSGQQ